MVELPFEIQNQGSPVDGDYIAIVIKAYTNSGTYYSAATARYDDIDNYDCVLSTIGKYGTPVYRRFKTQEDAFKAACRASDWLIEHSPYSATGRCRKLGNYPNEDNG